ncbi:unnamed protein product, partial [Meganyctiphanes norvegica]
QITEIKQPMKSILAEKESNLCQSNNSVFDATNLPNEVSNINSNAVCIQSNGENGMKIKTSKPGKLRPRVGRCPHDEVPLYLQPEPENKEEKRKWRRAITAYEHRMREKAALADQAKKIEDIIKEMNELRNQLHIVSSQRDTYKNTWD